MIRWNIAPPRNSLKLILTGLLWVIQLLRASSFEIIGNSLPLRGQEDWVRTQ